MIWGGIGTLIRIASIVLAASFAFSSIESPAITLKNKKFDANVQSFFQQRKEKRLNNHLSRIGKLRIHKVS